MKEIISICVGDAGLRVGNEYWRLLANEHCLDFDTGQMKQQIEGNEGIHKVFQENRLNGEFIPRSIFIDANEMCYEKVFEEQNITKNCMKVLGKYESSVNFAEGKYNLYKNIKNDVDDAIAKELEKCDSLDTILIFASTCGGTGSAFISKFATIFQNYINFIQVPSTLKMNNPIEIYNAQLSLSSFYSNHSFSVLADNYSAYNIYNKKKKFFGISAPSKEKALDKINKVLAHVYSNITAPSRFGNSYSLKNLIVDSKDYPVECMSIPSIECKDYSPTNSYDSVEILTKETLSLNNSLLQSNTSLYRIVSTSLFYRGNISQFDVCQVFRKYYETVTEYEKQLYRKHKKRNQEEDKNEEVKEKYNIASFDDGVENMPKYYTDWNPKGRNFKICEQTIHDHLEATSVSITSQIYYYMEYLHYKFDYLYGKRYFVHQFVGSGMEESELSEAREDLAAFYKDVEFYSAEYFGCYCCRFEGEGEGEGEEE